jgi:rare lipoprotein A
MIAAPAVAEPLPAVGTLSAVAAQPAAGTLSAAVGASPAVFALTGHAVLARPRLVIRHARLDVLARTPATVSGALLPAVPGRVVTLRVLGRHGWHTVARSLTGRRGRFALRYVPHGTGARRVEVRFGGDGRGLAVRRVLGRLRVYRLVLVSWYGGGGSLACGGTLTSSTMGVANKTLPCGTFVTLRYGGRSVRVPVVDRGPFVPGREFDLTEATKRALGFEGVGELWSSR